MERQHATMGRAAALLIGAALAFSGCGVLLDLPLAGRMGDPVDVPVSAHAIAAENLDEIEELGSMRIAVGPVNAVVFAPAGHTFASLGEDRELRLWDADTGRLLDELYRHKAAGYGLAFSPDGSRLVSGGLAGSQDVRLWDVESGEQIRQTGILGFRLSDAAWAPNGESFALVSGGSHQLYLYSASGRPMTERSPSELWLLSVAYGADMIAAGNQDGTIFLHTTGTFDYLNRLHYAGLWPSRDLEFSPDETLLAHCIADGVVNIWNTSTYQVITAFQAHEQYVGRDGGCRDGEFTVGGDVYVTGGDDGQLIAWDPLTGEELWRLDFGLRIQTVSLSSDGELLAVGLFDGTLHLLGLPRDLAMYQKTAAFHSERCRLRLCPGLVSILS